MAVLQEFKCPCCDGAIEFDSTLQKMKCPYCDAEFEMEALQAYDADLNSQPQENMTWPLTNKIYAEPYYLCNSPYPDEQTVRVETKYHEIIYHLKNIIDVKTKRGELE